MLDNSRSAHQRVGPGHHCRDRLPVLGLLDHTGLKGHILKTQISLPRSVCAINTCARWDQNFYTLPMRSQKPHELTVDTQELNTG